MQLFLLREYQNKKAAAKAALEPEVRDAATSDAADGLDSLADKARGDLTWPLQEVVGQTGFGLCSDQLRRRHVLRWPRAADLGSGLTGGDGMPSYLAYLHELVHARLAETVHPFFACTEPLPGGDPELAEETRPAFQLAADWFVEHELLHVCPDRKAPEMARQFQRAQRLLANGGCLDKPTALELALLLAKGRYFLLRRLNLQGPLEELVLAFGKTPADKPSLFTLRALVNRLLGLHYRARAEVAASPWGQYWHVASLRD